MASSTTLEVLLMLFSVFLIWYITFLWKRRNLYIYSRNVPGPFALPIIGAAHTTDLSPSGIVNTLGNLFESYPGLCKLWIGPYLIYCISKPEYIKTVLTNKDALHKSSHFYNIISALSGTGLLTAPVNKWKGHRKCISPTFDQKHINSYVSVFVKQSNIFCNQLRQYIGMKNFDMFSVIASLTLDIAYENLMGLELNEQTKNRGYHKIIDRVLQLLLSRISKFWLYSDVIFKLTSSGKEMEKSLREVNTIFSRAIDAKKKEYELRKSLRTAEVTEETEEIIHPFLETAIEKSYFTPEDLLDEMKNLVIGSVDTTTITLTILFEMLGLHQDIQQKVYEEAIQILGDHHDVESSDLPELKYTERVIKETLRLFPPVPFYLRELRKDIDLGKVTLPKGASVLVSPLSLHRNEKYWPDSLKFDPDRFLLDRVAKLDPCTYIPFSYGPRNCIGERYGMLSFKATVATVIRKYSFLTEYKSIEDIKLGMSLFLTMKGGSKLSVKLR